MVIVGKYYPIRDENNEIVDYKPITRVTHLSNVAGIVVSLSEADPSILITYTALGILSDSKPEGL